MTPQTNSEQNTVVYQLFTLLSIEPCILQAITN